MVECHYAGFRKLNCRIVPYTTDSGEQGAAYIHLKKDFKWAAAEYMPKKVLSFTYDKTGIGMYKKGNLLFIGFNFAYFTSLMLIKNGGGQHACFATGDSQGLSKEEVLKMDAADEVVDMEDLDLSKIDAFEAESIYIAMEDLDNGGASYTPILFMETYKKQKPLWNKLKNDLKKIVDEYWVA